MRLEMEMRPLDHGDAPACDGIIASLPYHFGQAEGRRQCAQAVRRDPGLGALVDGVVVGFLTIERHFETSAEITWMAVHAEHRRQGIGSALVARLSDELRREGRRLLLVFTISPSEDLQGEPDDGYQATRAFYAKAGFTLARDFPGLWERDTAVLMVRVP